MNDNLENIHLEVTSVFLTGFSQQSQAKQNLAGH